MKVEILVTSCMARGRGLGLGLAESCASTACCREPTTTCTNDLLVSSAAGHWAQSSGHRPQGTGPSVHMPWAIGLRAQVPAYTGPEHRPQGTDPSVHRPQGTRHRSQGKSARSKAIMLQSSQQIASPDNSTSAVRATHGAMYTRRRWH